MKNHTIFYCVHVAYINADIHTYSETHIRTYECGNSHRNKTKITFSIILALDEVHSQLDL
jgi:hypothetical protein